MLRYRDGDATAFDDLYTRHRAPLFRYILRQCGERALAEEMVQDVWLRIVKARARYEVRAKFTTYLYTLAHNRIIDHYRRSDREIPSSYASSDAVAVEEIEANLGDQPEVDVEACDLVERFTRALTNLPEAQREVFILRQEAGLSIEDIAAAVGVNRETAKSRLRYAVAKIRAELSE